MLDIFSQYATDEKLEVEGTWRDIGSGARLLVARANNRKYAKLLNQLIEQNKAVLDLEDDVADAKSREIMIECSARTILLGWENLAYQGQSIEYSTENAKKLLKHTDFRVAVFRLADEQAAYRVKEEAKQGEA